MKLLALSLAIASLTATSPAAAATHIFSFSGTNLFGGQPIVGSGTLTTNDMTVQQNGRDAQQITAITGLFNGSSITGLNPTIFGADNFYYLTGQFVSGNGLSFDTAAGASANLFASVGSYRVNAVNPFQTGSVTASSTTLASAAPEPAAWAMLLIGFAGIGGALRRRGLARTTVASS